MKKVLLILLLMVILLTACNSRVNNQEILDKDNYILELEEKIENLVIENEKVLSNLELVHKEEVESKNMEISSLNKDLKNNVLTKNEKKFIKLLDSLNGSRMYTQGPDNGISIKVVMNNSLRVLPFDDAPFINWHGELSFGDDNRKITREGNLVYTYYDYETKKEWCLITTNNQDFGYIESDKIISYDYKVQNNKLSESFKGLQIGIHIEDVYEMFDGEIIESYGNRFAFKYLQVNKNNPNSSEKEDLGVYFSCNPTSRKVIGISVVNEDFPLESGFKVGDSLNDIAAYYDEKYGVEEVTVNDGEDYRYKSYDIGDGYYIEFDTIEEGIVNHIRIATYTTF